MLAAHLRSEFLAVPQLVRLDMAHGADGPEPTLLIKASSLLLKYLVRRQSMRLVLTRVGDEMAYGVEIPDDPDYPATAWSLMALPAEAQALETLSANPRCVVFLFNEVAASVAWTEIEIRVDPVLAKAARSATLRPEPGSDDADRVSDRLTAIRADPAIEGAQVFQFDDIEWREIKLHYVTNGIGVSGFSVFNTDEGGQQEEIAVWMTDALHPEGCIKSPQLQLTKPREWTDVLLTYENGVFLIESKALSVLTRDVVPDRAKLASGLLKHLTKATDQLAGCVRNLKAEIPVHDRAGQPIEMNREAPAHAIVLVPDLTLLADAEDFGAHFVAAWMEKTGAYLHFFDPAELLRMVQVAEMVSEDSAQVTRIMGFDWYLLERTKRALKTPTPCFHMLFRRE